MAHRGTIFQPFRQDPSDPQGFQALRASVDQRASGGFAASRVTPAFLGPRDRRAKSDFRDQSVLEARLDQPDFKVSVANPDQKVLRDREGSRGTPETPASRAIVVYRAPPGLRALKVSRVFAA